MTWYALRSSQRMEHRFKLHLNIYVVAKSNDLLPGLVTLCFIPNHLSTCTLYRNKILAQKLLSNLSKDVENETHFILEFGCLLLEQQIVG